MKTNLLIAFLLIISSVANAQVTQINSNRSLETGIPISNNKAIFISDIDSTVWVTDGTAAGTIQLSTTIHVKNGGGVVNGKFVFTATSAEYGPEMYITDGTIPGTSVMKDINPGPAGSNPDEDMALLNGIIYFTAASPANGRELWKSDGTNAGTTLVRDIVPGSTGSNDPNKYDLYATNSYLLFSVKTTTTGTELWKSDGTDAGTVMVKDINTGAASSSPTGFQLYNNIVLFTANDATHGTELWKTDGTEAGTVLVKDINANTPGSSIGTSFYQFNSRAYFTANNGFNGSELWSTDGTEAGTIMVKDIEPGFLGSFSLLFNAVKVGNKFFFGAYTINNGFELWECDGTTAGTKLFKDIYPGSEGSSPITFSTGFNFTGGNQPLFQGNKFFFMAETENEGTELWVSDGTLAGTSIVKDINPGGESGITSPSYMYTTTAFYFSANNGANGNELWKTDGTLGGTSMVADINAGTGNSDPVMSCFLNGKLIFSASDGDVPNRTDLYVLDGNLVPLPVKLTALTVVQKNNDAMVQWTTEQEVNMKDYSVQRSFDGFNFTNIGVVASTGSSIKQSYSYTDAGIINSGKDVVYYRLISEGKDGKREQSKVISLKLKGAGGFNVKLVTNPVQNEIRVMLNGSAQNTQLCIKDMQGRTMYTCEPKSTGLVSLPASNLPRGIYVLVAENNHEITALNFLKH